MHGDMFESLTPANQEYRPPAGNLIIPHEYLSRVLRLRVSSSQLRLLLAIIDETMGWGKSEVAHGLGYWAMRANIDSSNVGRELSALQKCGAILWIRGSFTKKSMGTIHLVHTVKADGVHTVKADGVHTVKADGVHTVKADGSSNTLQYINNTATTLKAASVTLTSRESPKNKNGWALWIDVRKDRGLQAPFATGADTKASAELSKLIPDQEDLKKFMGLFLDDDDLFLDKVGKSLRYLPGRLEKYRNNLEFEGMDDGYIDATLECRRILKEK